MQWSHTRVPVRTAKGSVKRDKHWLPRTIRCFFISKFRDREQVVEEEWCGNVWCCTCSTRGLVFPNFFFGKISKEPPFCDQLSECFICKFVCKIEMSPWSICASSTVFPTSVSAILRACKVSFAYHQLMDKLTLSRNITLTKVLKYWARSVEMA